jgi:hypothetical protein
MLFEENVANQLSIQQFLSANEDSRLMTFDIHFHDSDAFDLVEGIQPANADRNAGCPQFQTSQTFVAGIVIWKTKNALTIPV